ncbi:MAG: conjugal transfer protein TraB, partial [Novosphingobium sp.]|nr:conjugal transfer protein TraB [Novosphingobium sp.]
MADAHDTKHESETRPTEPKDTGRKDTRRNLNANIAQRQKLLLAGIGGVALLAGAWFILDDDDSASADSESVASIDTGGLVNRNLSQREFVATYGNRLDAQGRAIKDLQDTQLPRPEIEQELEALRAENARMMSDGQ